MSVRCQSAVHKQTGRAGAVGGNGEAEDRARMGALVRSNIRGLLSGLSKLIACASIYVGV